jgi:hypothetical protein
MWLIADYQAVALFSLKMSMATSSGGKSLLLPTPYAIKMALLDVACRVWGVSRAEAEWPMLRDAQVALCPPERIVVTNLFTKVLKPRRTPAEPGSPHAGPLGKTIAFREYVYHAGAFGVAVSTVIESARQITDLLIQINYLGKRGGFVQLVSGPAEAEELPDDFIIVNGALPSSFALESVLHQMDDCDETLTFEKANIYSGASIKLGKERVLRNVILPYRLARSSKSFTLYERIE